MLSQEKKIFLQILLLVWNMRWEFQNLFWLNLQANYDAELLEFNKEQSITEERSARES